MPPQVMRFIRKVVSINKYDWYVVSNTPTHTFHSVESYLTPVWCKLHWIRAERFLGSVNSSSWLAVRSNLAFVIGSMQSYRTVWPPLLLWTPASISSRLPPPHKWVTLVHSCVHLATHSHKNGGIFMCWSIQAWLEHNMNKHSELTLL